jgi:hypothetical protein
VTTQQAVLDNDAIREAIEACLPADPSASLPDQQLFLPWPHRKALNLDCSLVIGARGVGKTAWARALLANQDHQRTVALPSEIFPYPLTVVAGFSDQAQTSHPSGGIFAKLISAQDDPYSLWLAVLLRALGSDNTSTLPLESWVATFDWVRGHHEEAWAILRQADQALLQENRGLLLVFDALDRVSPDGDWLQVSAAIRALLRLILELKGFKRLHGKVFLRTDQYARGSFTDLPDIAKIRANRIELLWSLTDLHGLLWQCLCNGTPCDAREHFRYWCQDASAKSQDPAMELFKNDLLLLNQSPAEDESSQNIDANHRWELPTAVQRDEPSQRALFEKLAGRRMGRDSRRGVPYTWIVNHLADAQGQTTPRSFLTAIRKAAEESRHRYPDAEYPLFYDGLKLGVQAASSNRINELEEDHPWLPAIMKPFSNRASVPMTVAVFDQELSEAFGLIPADVPGLIERLPKELRSQGVHGLITYLCQLGLLTQMKDERLNMPDIYRIGFKLGRKGGIKPAQRSTPQAQ